jgi:O-antigen ligase
MTVGVAMAASRRRRVWWTAAVILQFAALALTFSRAPLGLAAIGVIALIVLANRPILLVPLAATAALVMWLTPLVARFQSDSTDRLALWAAALRIFADHPLGGVGAGRMLPVMRANPDRYVQTPLGSAVNNAHNTVLLASAELGFLAAAGALILNLVLAFMALVTIRDSATGRPRFELGMAAGIAVLAVLVQGMVNNLFTVGATGVILALLVGVFLWPGATVSRSRSTSRADPLPAAHPAP